jgi:hypothetical protein
MALLGLEPGTSATERLEELAAGPLPDHAVRALTAATGMTADQARALTAPRTARPDVDSVRRVTEHNFAAGHYRRPGTGKTSTRGLSAAVALALAQRAGVIAPDAEHIQPGGTGKTRTDTGDLARLLAETSGLRPLLFGLPVNELRPNPYTPVVIDLDWAADASRPPIAPEVLDEVTKALRIGQDTDTDAPPRE